MPKAVEEFLYPAMEDFRIDLTLGEGVNARVINMQLRPFTLIGATTAPACSRPRSATDFRCASIWTSTRWNSWRRSFAATRRNCGSRLSTKRRWRSPAAAGARLGWPTTGFAGSAIMRKARPTEDFARVARDALAMQGIDPLGLDSQDRKYLETIARCLSAGRWALRLWPIR